MMSGGLSRTGSAAACQRTSEANACSFEWPPWRMCSFVVLTDELRPRGGTVRTDIDPRHLIGRKAFDRNGDKIGTIDEVYLDDATGEPEWAAIRTGLFS